MQEQFINSMPRVTVPVSSGQNHKVKVQGVLRDIDDR